MIKRKKLGLLKASIAIAICLGLASMPAVTASLPGYPDETMGKIYQDDWILFATLDFEEGYQVYMRLCLVDYVPLTDLDVFVYGPTFELIWIGGSGSEPYEDPTITEQGYFFVPETGMYSVFIYGCNVPDTDGIDITLYVDYGDDLIEIPPLEPNDIKWGTLESYVSSSGNARFHASEYAAFRKGGEVTQWYPSILTTHNAFVNILTASSSPYELPLTRFCAEDHIGLGGHVWWLPAEGIDHETAEWMFDFYYYEHYLDGIPLAELTDVYNPPMYTVRERGEVVYYVKMQETALFKSGELFELVGGGLHVLTSTIPALPWFLMDNCFYILPEGSTLP